MPNARPSASFDRIPVSELDTIAGNLLANDSDPDGNSLFLRFVDGVRIDARHGAHHATEIAGEHGTFSFMPDGSFTYELRPDVAQFLTPGEMVVENLSYKVSDGLGGTDVSALRLEVSGAEPGLVLKTIDFEDLSPGTTVPGGYQGFNWGDGWIVDTDGGGEVTPDAHVAQPLQHVDVVRLESGADFDLIELVLNGDTDTSNPVQIRGFNDGVQNPSYIAMYGAGIEPSLVDLQWQGIDAFEITYSTPGMWIDDITVAVPNI